MSDATLSILSAKNNVIKEVRFRDVFPVSVSGVGFSTQASDVSYLTSSVTFKYLMYDFAEELVRNLHYKIHKTIDKY